MNNVPPSLMPSSVPDLPPEDSPLVKDAFRTPLPLLPHAEMKNAPTNSAPIIALVDFMVSPFR
jgi:hypothetical protein